MITKIIFCAAVSSYVLGKDVAMKTVDSGGRNSANTPNVAEYYTALSNYGIVPSDERFLKFQLKACAHAYVLFSESYNITDAKQFYEIVIGGYINTRDLIRRRYKHGKDQQLIQNITKSLSCHEYRTFFIKWSADGNVKLGRDSNLILNLTDQDPIQVNAFGIMTNNDNEGSWIFELKDDKSMCRCSCEYKAKLEFWSTQNLTNQTREELIEMLNPKIEAIKKELKVNKYNLSTNRRRRTSAADNRKSARQIGIVGIVVLSVVIGLIVMIDITAVRKGFIVFRSSAKIKPRR